jgi:hypothetical protein
MEMRRRMIPPEHLNYDTIEYTKGRLELTDPTVNEAKQWNV